MTPTAPQPNTTAKIELPILIWAGNNTIYKNFVAKAEFVGGETRYVRDLETLKGYKNKMLFFVETDGHYAPRDMYDYAVQHEMRIIRA
jgi:hypothetical protein